MKHVVIAGSASAYETNMRWVEFWDRQTGCVVTDYPKRIPKERFDEEYPDVHKEFFQRLKDADILFVANGPKQGIEGYIGAEVFAEIAFAVTLNLIDGRHIKILLANMPSEQVQSHDEIQRWLRLGWISMFTTHP